LSGDLAADRSLGEGDRVDLGGGIVVTTLHTPGHSPGSVTFLMGVHRRRRPGGWQRRRPLPAGRTAIRLPRLGDSPQERRSAKQDVHRPPIPRRRRAADAGPA
jgi:hypothetical protein